MADLTPTRLQQQVDGYTLAIPANIGTRDLSDLLGASIRIAGAASPPNYFVSATDGRVLELLACGNKPDYEYDTATGVLTPLP